MMVIRWRCTLAVSLKEQAWGDAPAAVGRAKAASERELML
jgi:hypothetical protein